MWAFGASWASFVRGDCSSNSISRKAFWKAVTFQCLCWNQSAGRCGSGGMCFCVSEQCVMRAMSVLLGSSVRVVLSSSTP